MVEDCEFCEEPALQGFLPNMKFDGPERPACQARSRAEFISKMGIVEEEADESMYWLELLQDSGLVEPSELHDLYDEANAIVSIAVSSVKTARSSKTTKGTTRS